MSRGGALTLRAELRRLRVLLLGLLGLLAILLASLWRVQVAQGHEFEHNLERQSVRRVRLPGLRGEILDRHGRVLAGNRPSYCIAIYLEELRQARGRKGTEDRVMSLLEELSGVIGREVELTREDVATHMVEQLSLPLIAWRDLNTMELARFAEQAGPGSAVDIYAEAVRVYPEGETASHLLGAVKRTVKEQVPGEPYHYRYPETVGRSGLEKRYDESLCGVSGGRLVRVDVSGFRHEDLAVQEPRPGSDVLTAIDLDAQRAAEAALAGEEGAAVVLDPRNGDVLALASSPGYDPAVFVPYLSTADWERLGNDPARPLVNRATAGSYAPGSIFKPVVAFAALENGLIDGSTQYSCDGRFELGGSSFACWYRYGHGVQNVREAIRNSCNVFFFQAGLLCERERIAHMASALGLGRATGIDFDYEVVGNLPLGAEAREGWYSGDTCNLSIGQGPVIVTPLQMAVVCAAIANGGDVMWPRLVLGTREAGEESFSPVPPRVANHMNWAPSSIDLVRGGMRDVIMSPNGTGRLARIPGIDAAGKTGTAEFGPKGNDEKRVWMIAFAPFDRPRYAVALVLDRGKGGGVDAAPRVRRLLAALFGVDLEGGEVADG